MADQLDERLAGLRTTPVPPLAPAEAVRARGEQRRARARAVLAGAVAVTAVGVALGAAAVSAGPGTDSLQPAPFATPASEEPPVTVSRSALLDAEVLARLRGGAWTVTQPDLQTTSPFVTPCPEPPPEAPAGLTRVLDGPQPQSVASQVLAYADVAASAAALAGLVDDVARCPEQREDWNNGLASAQYALADSLPGAGRDRVYGTVTTRDCLDCARQVRYFSVSRVGRHLALVRLTGGAAEELPTLAEAAERQARCAEDACSRQRPPTPSPRMWALPDGFLSADEAVAAEHPGWRVVTPFEPEDAPLADPCREGSVPMADQVRETGERALSSEREAGGSSLVQELYRYSAPGAAEDAFRLYTDRYRRCAEVPDPHGAEGMTVKSEVVDLDERPAGGRLVVRRIPCTQGQCTEHFSTYVFVVQHGEALTVVGYMIAEDGDPAKEAAALALAVDRRLGAAVDG